MSTERPEFRPIESTPKAKRAWPFVVGGAVIVAVLLFAVRRDVAAGAVRAASLTDTAVKADVAKVAAAPAQPQTAAPVAEAPRAAEPAPAPVATRTKSPEGPNVLGTAVAGAKNIAMVAKAELEREISRTRNAQKESAAYRKQIEDLNKQLADARAQIAALQRTKAPPPPSDQEQILQMLAPVLRSSNDSRN
ncbi:MAG: hypothetical protein ACJ78U_13700 [Myxococcales bacterium]